MRTTIVTGALCTLTAACGASGVDDDANSNLASDGTPSNAPATKDINHDEALDRAAENLYDEESSSDDIANESDTAEFGTGDLTVLAIVDRSGSMAEQWEVASRWNVATNLLLSNIEQVQDQLTVGTLFFPLGAECEVPEFGDVRQVEFTAGRAYLQDWTSSAGGMEPSGGTPLGQAFLAADRAIETAKEAGLLAGRFRVVVVTDGEPNCGTDYSLLTNLPAKWRDQGIETRVIGLPGSAQAASVLDAIAGKGGSVQHQAVSSSEQLDDEYYAAVR